MSKHKLCSEQYQVQIQTLTFSYCGSGSPPKPQLLRSWQPEDWWEKWRGMSSRVPKQDPSSRDFAVSLPTLLLVSLKKAVGQLLALGSPLSRRSRPWSNSTRPVWPDQTAVPPWAVQESSFSTSNSFIFLETHWSLVPVFLDSLPSLLHAWAAKTWRITISIWLQRALSLICAGSEIQWLLFLLFGFEGSFKSCLFFLLYFCLFYLSLPPFPALGWGRKEKNKMWKK